MSGHQNRGGQGPGGGRGRPENGGGQGQQQSRGGFGTGSGGQGDARGGRGDSRGGYQDARGGRGGSPGGYRGQGDLRGDSRGGSSGGFRGSAQQNRQNTGPNTSTGQGGSRSTFNAGNYSSPRGGSTTGSRGGGAGSGPRPGKFAGEGEVFRQNAAGNVPACDRDVTKAEDDFAMGQVTAGTAKLSLDQRKPQIQGSTIPVRPAFGDQGHKIILWANYFKLITKSKPWYKYTIEVTRVVGEGADPSKEKVFSRTREAIIKEVLPRVCGNKRYASENKSQLIVLEELPKVQVEWPYAELGKPASNYLVKFVGPTLIPQDGFEEFLRQDDVTGTGDQPISQFEELLGAMGVILGQSARTNGAIAAVGGGSYFPFRRQDESRFIGGLKFLQVVRGYFLSARAATLRPLVNVNVLHNIFRPGGNLGTLLENSGLTDHFMDEMNCLKGARIKCRLYTDKPGQYIEVEKTIKGFAMKLEHDPNLARATDNYGRPGQVRFLVQGSKDLVMTVQDYYLKRHNLRLKNLPVINTGTVKKPYFFPAEFCEIIPGQPAKTSLTTRQAQDMIQFACRSPFANATSISTIARELLQFDNNQLLTDFGISPEKDLITVHGRELSVPALEYQERHIIPRYGSWNMSQARFMTSSPATKKWTWIEITRNPRQEESSRVRKATEQCIKFMIQRLGVKLSTAANHPDGLQVVIPRESDDPRDTPLAIALKAIRVTLKQAEKEGKLPDIALVVLPDKDTAVYNAVKILADIEFGFHTVCVTKNVLSKTEMQGGESTISNLALKFNLKIGGVNHVLVDNASLGPIRIGDTMVVGYDVIHPTNLSNNAQNNLPSQVGLVASIDSHLAQWPCTYWNQQGREEMLDDNLEKAFATRLDLWKKHNRRLPGKILIFRDGVSESQFQQVLDNELPHIRRALDSKYETVPKPQISIIVSVKRHHTRFYPTSASNMTQSRNIKNGTVVDRGVTQARYWEFFLASHTALQGTTRPARYVVLLDEVFRAGRGAVAANFLEQLVHHMSYLFGRATKAVSIIPPAYYADIVCTRARVHMAELFDAHASRPLTDEERQNLESREVHSNLKDSMYYI